MNFNTQLYIETNYAMRGSNITIDALLEKAKSAGFKSIAITDNRLYGAVAFYQGCRKYNIKPIIGLEVQVEGITPESKNKYVLYAKNNQGYQNLLILASIQANNQIITLSEMKYYNKGVIATLLSESSELLTFFRNSQKNSILEFFEMHQTYFEETYISLTNDDAFNQNMKQKASFVVLPKVSYLNQSDKEVQLALKKIFNIESSMDDQSTHLLDLDTVINEYKEYPNALKNTQIIADKCTVEIDFNTLHLPKYKMQKNATPKAYLEALVYKGLEKRLKNKKVDRKKYLDRVKYELSVIDQMGYNDYFLIVWDFVKYAKQKGYLVGPGRGSAAASLVSYCLGITAVDSLEYDLVFERFLNPERISLPDIDMDLPDDKRDDIIMYVRDLYGINKVASICTFGTFQKKSAIRDTARVYELSGILLNQILKESEKYNDLKTMIEENDKVKNIINQDQKAYTVLSVASEIEGLNRHVSTHAAGIIIGEDELTKHTALQPGLLDMMQTQYEAKDLEKVGLLKIDFLGLRNLTSIKKIAESIYQKEGKKIDIYKIPLDDQKTFELLQRVETTGIFQLESQGMRSLIRKMQIQSFDDIVTILALYRPGPMESIPTFLNRRFKKEKVSYTHPILKDILEPTNGIIIYQEQIIKIANVYAGYNLGEADLLRRAVSKKQRDVLELERTNFIKKAKQKGRKEQVANEIYDYIVKFANYGFNKAHSVAYAMVSYWLAYLKANYPTHFIAVLTSSVIGSERQLKNYIRESNKLGVLILPPSVNYSTDQFEPYDDGLRYPLLGIKNVGKVAVNGIIEERKNGRFTSYIDFVNRCQGFINKRVFESLIFAGALDEFGFSKRTMAESIEDVIGFNEYGAFIDKKQFTIKTQKEYGLDILKQNEIDVLGFNLFVNPLLKFKDKIEKHGLIKPSQIDSTMSGKQIRVIGIISKIKKIKTKNGKDMAFVSVEDEIISIDGVLFTTQYAQYQNVIEQGVIFLFLAKVEERNGNMQLVIEKVHNMSE